MCAKRWSKSNQIQLLIAVFFCAVENWPVGRESKNVTAILLDFRFWCREKRHVRHSGIINQWYQAAERTIPDSSTFIEEWVSDLFCFYLCFQIYIFFGARSNVKIRVSETGSWYFTWRTWICLEMQLNSFISHRGKKITKIFTKTAKNFMIFW